jgi:putative membrane-bound dehydrogenase-like protein
MIMRSVMAIGLFSLSATVLCPATSASAQVAPKANWVWFDEGDPLQSAPNDTVYFRRTFDENFELLQAEIHITCDNAFVLFINGKRIGSGGDWKDGKVFDLTQHLRRGKNAIAIEARNEGGPAGLVAWLVRLTKPGNHYTVLTDGTWKCSKEAPENWREVNFDDSKWLSPKVLSEFSRPDHWAGITWNGKSDASRFTVPEGFVIEQVAEAELTGSIVNMTFDWKGRPVVSRERGPILILDDEDSDGNFDKAKEYSDKVKNCQGILCYDRETYYLIGDGPDGTGLYRLKDGDADDRADTVELLHKFRGGMGEHGPHAIVAGPDGYLYLNAGNHAWVTAEPEPGSPVAPWIAYGQLHDKPETDRVVKSAGIDVPLRKLLRGYEADLLPRYEDANGHAAGIKVPGGTIWRLDPDAKHWTLEACGFRNHYDFGFNSLGELFTFDSDMEWDEFLPWYRPVAVFHSPPGADHGWRSGSNVSPDYFADYLPYVVPTGRGSPCGVVFYNHTAFPEKYHDAFFVTDWSYGRIFAVHLKREGASFQGKAEEFVTGKPLNVTDLEVAPDGSLLFTTGGRNTEGGVYRIRVVEPQAAQPAKRPVVVAALDEPQPQSAWAREMIRQAKLELGEHWGSEMEKVASDPSTPVERRMRAISYLMQFGPEPSLQLARKLMSHKDPEIRAQAAVLLARHPSAHDDLVLLLDDRAAVVQRRALEGLLRMQSSPPLNKLKPLLASQDRFLQHSARLALERIPTAAWQKSLMDEKSVPVPDSQRIVIAGLIVLNKVGAVAADPAIAGDAYSAVKHLLYGMKLAHDPRCRENELDTLRAIELTLVNTAGDTRPKVAQEIGAILLHRFPTGKLPLDRELSRAIAALQVPGGIGKLLREIEKTGSTDSLDARADAIHYARCLMGITDGWTWDERLRFLKWYDVSRDWKGGHSYAGFINNFLRDTVKQLNEKELLEVVQNASKFQRAATRALASDERVNDKADAAFVPALAILLDANPSPVPRADVLLALGRTGRAEAEAVLLKQYEQNAGELRDVTVRALANFQNARNWDIFVRSLDSQNKETVRAALHGLSGIEQKPDGPAPYRAAIHATTRLGDQTSWDGIVLLRQWSGKHFGHKRSEWRAELAQWQKWYADTYPDAPSATLPEPAAPQHSWGYDQLLAFLEGDGRNGSIESGRKIFEKSDCAKCHRIEQVGQSIGPDLTTLASRFKRKEILEAIIYPSRTLTDQYKSYLIATKDGRVITAMKAPDDGDNYVLLLSDASTMKLPMADVEEMIEGKQSVMPDGLLNRLELSEIADLFAFLESGKAAAPTANGQEKK